MRIQTTHYQIFEYWKDKYIDKYGNISNQYDEGRMEVVYDWGEPQCWCCHGIIKVEDEPEYNKWIEAEDFKSIWNSNTLKHCVDRAHIIPKMLGGTDDPSNLFLLCPKCHKESPDTDNPNIFLMYIYEQRNGGYIPDLFVARDKIIKMFGFFPIFSSEEEIFKHIGQHGGSISRQSIIGAYISDALRNRSKLSKESELVFIRFMNKQIAELERKIATETEDKDLNEIQCNTFKAILTVYEACKQAETITNV